MILRIEPDSHVPPYEQIRSQIATMAVSGVLREGSRLPAIRQLASDLGLAGGTVARAYRELEQEGVIVTRGRHGTFIRKVPSRGGGGELEAAARSFAVRAAQLGADQARAVESIRRALESVTASTE
ncbi:MAG: GntR family transcriptional regulator [Actinobacteria bacterium]|nr:GntR family transcriptional regulator [Actinomycetota bacterium]